MRGGTTAGHGETSDSGSGSGSGSGSIRTRISSEVLPRELTPKYRLDSLIAVGGMGRVYAATQLPLNRRVAIKLLTLHNEEDDFHKRFFLEASLSSRLKHPNIVTVHDYGETAEGALFMVMELLDGAPITDVLAREVRLEPARACRIALEVCRALRAAHRESLAHRDLKPGNVMLTRGEEDGSEHVKVLDFGLVKVFQEGAEAASLERDLTRGQTMLGSPRYMAPEQILCETVDDRTDIYALGVLLFTMIAGEPPFGGRSTVAILQQHLNSPVPPLAEKMVLRPGESAAAPPPAGLDDVIRRCMEKKPADRFQTISEVMQALAPFTGAPARGSANESMELSVAGLLPGLRTGVPGTTPTPGPIPPELRPPAPDVPDEPRSRSRSGAIVATIAGVVLVGAVLAWRGLGSEPAPTEPAPAEPTLAEPTPPAAAPASTRLLVTSTPSGAEVRAGGELWGTTPLEREIPSADGERIELELTLEGHQPARAPALLRGETVAVHVELPASAAPPPATTPPATTPPPASSSSSSSSRRRTSAPDPTPPPVAAPPPPTPTPTPPAERPRRTVDDAPAGRAVPIVD